MDNGAIGHGRESEDALVLQGRRYSLTVAPAYQDPLVQRESKNVLRQLSLHDVTEHLDLAVELFQMAYHAAAGARCGAVPVEIAALQSQLSLLCSDALKTMAGFRAETNHIVGQLVQTYRALLAGQEGLAALRLAHCAEASASLSAAAEALAMQMRQLQVETAKVRASTLQALSSQRERQLGAEKAGLEMLKRQRAERTLRTELVEQLAGMEALHHEARALQESDSARALVMGMVSALAGTAGVGLGAFTAMLDPVDTLLAADADGAEGADTAQARREAQACREAAEAGLGQLLEVRDRQAGLQARVNELSNLLARMNQRIAERTLGGGAGQPEAAGGEDAAVLARWRAQRDALGDELSAAVSALAGVRGELQPLEPAVREALAAYAAAGAALQELARQGATRQRAATGAHDIIRDEKLRVLQRQLTLEQDRRRSLLVLAGYAQALHGFRAVTDAEGATLAVGTLQAAVEALGQVMGSLTDASLYWNQMSACCDRLSSEEFQAEIRELTDPGSGVDAAQRLREYRDARVLRSFLRDLCQWVAVNGLAAEQLQAADEAQRKALQGLAPSPSLEAALRQAPALARYLEDLVGRHLRASRRAQVALERQQALVAQVAVA
ncbi:hypothetical protein [Azohydromonas caseinilytica]|uniref:Uncharacterized protein n=1 Tax=Azohydromonas caseinilytica TaxID=2728836 RepID=A0A848F3N7_9BURK|nr:hypothetical protein [Azohydromonas caseinilytica]NML14697.1 hypothetical protein [Azohydromonas caseinilytica]